MPYVIHGLGTVRFGLLALASMVLGYFTIFDLGLGRSTTRFLAEAIGAKRSNELPGLFWSAILMQLCFGSLCGIALLVVAPFLVRHFLTVPQQYVQEAIVMVRLIAVSIPVAQVCTALRGTLEATQRFEYVNLVSALYQSATFIIPVLCVHSGLRLPVFVILLLIAKTAACLAFGAFDLTLLPSVRKIPHIGRGQCRKILAYGGWVSVSSLVGPLFNYFERILIASFLSLEAFAFYTVPFEMLSKTVLLGASVSSALFPVFSGHGGDLSDLSVQTFSRPLKYLMWISTPVSMILVALGRPILMLWLGPDFAAKSTKPFQLLAIAFFLNSLAFIPWSAVLGLNRPEWKAKLDLLQLPIFVCLCFFLIPSYGLVGAALCRLVFSAIDLLALSFLASRLLALPVAKLWRSVGRTVMASVGFGAAAILLAHTQSLPLLCAGLTILILLYGVVIAAVAVDPTDWAVIAGLRRRVLASKWA